jgi:hypothetical protein
MIPATDFRVRKKAGFERTGLKGETLEDEALKQAAVKENEQGQKPCSKRKRAGPKALLQKLCRPYLPQI